MMVSNKKQPVRYRGRRSSAALQQTLHSGRIAHGAGQTQQRASIGVAYKSAVSKANRARLTSIDVERDMIVANQLLHATGLAARQQVKHVAQHGVQTCVGGEVTQAHTANCTPSSLDTLLLALLESSSASASASSSSSSARSSSSMSSLSSMTNRSFSRTECSANQTNIGFQ